MSENNKADKGAENKDFNAEVEQTEKEMAVGGESAAADNVADEVAADADNVAEQLTDQVAEWKDKYIRLAAE